MLHPSPNGNMADHVSPRQNRAPSVSSTATASTTGGYNFIPRYMPKPEPMYISSTSASEHIRHLQQNENYDLLSPSASPTNDGTFVSDNALHLLNSFLDSLLYNFLGKARGTDLSRLRPAIVEVLKAKLGREALASADEELEGLVGEDEDIEYEEYSNGVPKRPGSAAPDWHLESAFKRMRLRVMVFIRLGDFDDDDEQRFMEDEEYSGTQELNFSASPAPVYLASVLEYLAEHALTLAGQAALTRSKSKLRRVIAENKPVDSFDAETVSVEETDVEKIALNPSLGRLWRTWRKHQRQISSPVSPNRGFARRGSADDIYRRHSIPKALEAAQGNVILEESENPSHEEIPDCEPTETDIAANIPLPTRDNDVDEIEVPGLATVIYDVGEERFEEDEIEELYIRPRSTTFDGPSAPLDIPGTFFPETPLEQPKPIRPGLQRGRSNSVPAVGPLPWGWLPLPVRRLIKQFAAMSDRDLLEFAMTTPLPDDHEDDLAINPEDGELDYRPKSFRSSKTATPEPISEEAIGQDEDTIVDHASEKSVEPVPVSEEQHERHDSKPVADSVAAIAPIAVVAPAAALATEKAAKPQDRTVITPPTEVIEDPIPARETTEEKSVAPVEEMKTQPVAAPIEHPVRNQQSSIRAKMAAFEPKQQPARLTPEPKDRSKSASPIERSPSDAESNDKRRYGLIGGAAAAAFAAGGAAAAAAVASNQHHGANSSRASARNSNDSLNAQTKPMFSPSEDVTPRASFASNRVSDLSIPTKDSKRRPPSLVKESGAAAVEQQTLQPAAATTSEKTPTSANDLKTPVSAGPVDSKLTSPFSPDIPMEIPDEVAPAPPPKDESPTLPPKDVPAKFVPTKELPVKDLPVKDVPASSGSDAPSAIGIKEAANRDSPVSPLEQEAAPAPPPKPATARDGPPKPLTSDGKTSVNPYAMLYDDDIEPEAIGVAKTSNVPIHSSNPSISESNRPWTPNRGHNSIGSDFGKKSPPASSSSDQRASNTIASPLRGAVAERTSHESPSSTQPTKTVVSRVQVDDYDLDKPISTNHFRARPKESPILPKFYDAQTSTPTQGERPTSVTPGQASQHSPKGSQGSQTTQRSHQVKRVSEEAKEREFDALLDRKETVKYTLTPEEIREPYHKSPTMDKKIPAPIDTTRKHSLPGALSPSLFKRSTPKEPASPKRPLKISDIRKGISALSPEPIEPKMRRSGLMARDARVYGGETKDFVDFIRSCTPTSEDQTQPYVLSKRLSGASSLNGLGGIGHLQSTNPNPNRNSIGVSNNVPNGVSPRPAAPGLKKNLVPREADNRNTAGSGDLIDFIREGPPPEKGNRTSGPTRNKPSGEVPGSLLNKPLPGGAGSAPTRKQHRNKDPYAIDLSDDEDGFTALPNTTREEPATESLADFLRSASPPASSPPRPIRTNGANTSSLRGTGPGSNAASAPPAMNGKAAGAMANQRSSSSGFSGAFSRKRLEARPAGATRAFGGHGYYYSTHDLADYLRTSGPNGVSANGSAAPSPNVHSRGSNSLGGRTTPSGSVRKSDSLRTKFWNRKGVET